MPKHAARWLALIVAAIPFLVASQLPPPEEPTCEKVFKNIEAFKGVPAKDLIPSMEFMAASLKVECSECHKEGDFAAPTPGKNTARRMIAMQRDINAKFFGGRKSVTCMSCHNGKDHPATAPIPEGTKLRHARIDSAPKPEELFAKHLKAIGSDVPFVKLTGMQYPPFGTEKGKGEPVELIQSADGKFALTAKSTKFGSDGKQVWRDGAVVTDEPAAIFGRMGRSWRGAHAFDGLEKLSVSGKETVGKSQTTIVRGTRTITGSTEELYFDINSGLLVRFVNVTHSSLGNVVTAYDYSHFKSIGGMKVPMDVLITFADGIQWSMSYKSAKALDKADDATFAPPHSG